ncbi:Hypothetical protein NCS54_01198900 [Fusarium falciforme]|uniref:Hypothetical protein n=1 Tax=Fusarium falciforme TaxID=195108 RepID=UPI002301A65A|nr:Hypothetical protein NCS54_01198900 [Fusarium falciforme]WAO94407.1 Hypothetical protein NCS54_01198900 [Fusarium falciforme]
MMYAMLRFTAGKTTSVQPEFAKGGTVRILPVHMPCLLRNQLAKARTLARQSAESTVRRTLQPLNFCGQGNLPLLPR